eukprot:TRINITY_DN4017_c0_g1_i3.p1 TRINITY_DN4017_c0_g1~~TRINITY_DN4017_c0_g1_i3.p1  ORF type:complete len:402 (+),score=47.05 TRINITY_DN4017_c0_g1_i3:148-1206(+)
MKHKKSSNGISLAVPSKLFRFHVSLVRLSFPLGWRTEHDLDAAAVNNACKTAMCCLQGDTTKSAPSPLSFLFLYLFKFVYLFIYFFAVWLHRRVLLQVPESEGEPGGGERAQLPARTRRLRALCIPRPLFLHFITVRSPCGYSLPGSRLTLRDHLCSPVVLVVSLPCRESDSDVTVVVSNPFHMRARLRKKGSSKSRKLVGSASSVNATSSSSNKGSKPLVPKSPSSACAGMLRHACPHTRPPADGPMAGLAISVRIMWSTLTLDHIEHMIRFAKIFTWPSLAAEGRGIISQSCCSLMDKKPYWALITVFATPQVAVSCAPLLDQCLANKLMNGLGTDLSPVVHTLAHFCSW